MVTVAVEGLSKCYALYRSPRDRLREWLSWGRRVYHRPLWALREVTFSLPAGTALGVIGPNGAGKSTLLGILAGTIQPTSGRISVRGRVSALLELGAGFHPEFSGRDNVFLAASLLGLTRDETEARYAAIVEFAGVGEFMDQPVRTYSSGMFVRLAFSVATCVDPDVLIVDEVLAVGDQEFQRRCVERIRGFLDAGKTLLLCSHDLYRVRQLCPTTLWLDRGRVVQFGETLAVTDAYMSADRALEPAPGPLQAPDLAGVPAADGAGPRLHRVRLLDRAGVPAARFATGELLRVEVQFTVPQGWDEEPSVGFALHRNDQVVVYGVSTEMDGVAPRVVASDLREVALELPDLPLLSGEYVLSLFLLDAKGVHFYDRHDRAYPFAVSNSSRELGLCRLSHRWR